MTLIVARKSKNNVLIVISDTKLSPPLEEKWSPIHQTNKIVCVHPNWCVAFAGHTYLAEKCLIEIAKIPTPDLDYSIINEILLKHNKLSLQVALDAKASVDFLLFNNINLSVYKIAEGKSALAVTGAAWIGDQDAFNKFQKIMNSPSDQKLLLDGKKGLIFRPQIIDQQHDDLYKKINRALDAVIDDNTISAVGGHAISMIAVPGRFQFWPLVWAGGMPTPNMETSPNRDPLFGEAQTGDFGFDVIPCRDSKDNAVAILYPLANKAYVFHRKDGGLPKAEMIQSITIDTAVDILKEKLGIDFWQNKVQWDSSITYTITDVNPPAPLI